MPGDFSGGGSSSEIRQVKSWNPSWFQTFPESPSHFYTHKGAFLVLVLFTSIHDFSYGLQFLSSQNPYADVKNEPNTPLFEAIIEQMEHFAGGSMYRTQTDHEGGHAEYFRNRGFLIP